jgi:phosphate/sulfate permease
MRYFIAIVCALVGAAIAFSFFSGPVSDWIITQQKFDSSDDVENLNQMTFMLVNLAGLIIGWTIGWALGGPVQKRQDAKHHVD